MALRVYRIVAEARAKIIKNSNPAHRKFHLGDGQAPIAQYRKLRLFRLLDSPMKYLTLLCALCAGLPAALWAQVPVDPAARIAALEAATRSAQSAGDNAWMLVSAALVLMMTGPGLALFYGGLVRRKNVLGTMMQSFILMAVVTVVWAVVGYSLAFGGSSAFVGDFHFAFLQNVGSAPNPDYAGTIPQ